MRSLTQYINEASNVDVFDSKKFLAEYSGLYKYPGRNDNDYDVYYFGLNICHTIFDICDMGGYLFFNIKGVYAESDRKKLQTWVAEVIKDPILIKQYNRYYNPSEVFLNTIRTPSTSYTDTAIRGDLSIANMILSGKFDKGTHAFNKVCKSIGRRLTLAEVHQVFLDKFNYNIGDNYGDYSHTYLWEISKPCTVAELDKIAQFIIKSWAEQIEKGLISLKKSREKQDAKDAAKHALQNAQLNYQGWRRFDVKIEEIETKPTKTGKTYLLVKGTTTNGYKVCWNEFFNKDLAVGETWDLGATIYMPASKANPYNRFEKVRINGRK